MVCLQASLSRQLAPCHKDACHENEICLHLHTYRDPVGLEMFCQLAPALVSTAFIAA